MAKTTEAAADATLGYGQVIHDLIENLYVSTRRKTPREFGNAFFVFEVGRAYVQALMHAGGRKLVMEVVSERHAPKLWRRLDASAPEQLARLGFKPPSRPRQLFQQIVPARTAEDRIRAARLLAAALYEVLKVDPKAVPKVTLERSELL